MIKKSIKYLVIIILLSIVLMLVYAFKPHKDDNEPGEENKTIEEQITDIMLIDKENDQNVIGYLSIEKIGLEFAPIADGTSNEIINKYIGHFENTPYLDGNICLCAHNRGSKAAYFEKLNEVSKGDEIIYQTKYETKTFIIKEIKEIEETDFSVLNPSEENTITLITCIKNKRNLRLCVVGVEKGEQ
ncbi:MAG: class D sortase [Clostridiales bacterium]|nr:class D sortase [Clostridiales bacterium]